MNMDGVRYVRDRFNVPVADADLEKLPYVTFRKVPKSTLTCTLSVRS